MDSKRSDPEHAKRALLKTTAALWKIQVEQLRFIEECDRRGLWDQIPASREELYAEATYGLPERKEGFPHPDMAEFVDEDLVEFLINFLERSQGNEQPA